MRIISPRHVERIEEYSYNFDLLDNPGAGYSFPCDKEGNLFLGLNPAAAENLVACATGKYKVGTPYIRDLSRDYTHEEIRECEVCHAGAYMDRKCGVFVCSSCEQHEGLARCFCGWSASGGDGYRELAEMGENLEEDY